ncbi:nucleotidyltransferase family protein [Salinisphaera sp. Q1T1-3]|uniref:nucleotidyltransferase family protein n=1 Tax=Salinisphaera sp. Q1T1-3 TaxID=2321229 RepID=UPI0018F676C3|nr:nucleotidyltransferase family protein [Salinisphaera sp. Q1T1-3]
MMIVVENEKRFVDLVQHNPINGIILDRLSHLRLPNSYLVAGCLFQTVWNVLSDNDPMQGINDYDVFYFDQSDTSWDAENTAIQSSREAFSDLDVDVQVRNQARVHLWYQEKFGVGCEPLVSSEDGIDHFLNQSSCFGLRKMIGGNEVYAPFGYEDLFSMVVRPNRRRALPDVYYAKANRWKSV